MNCPARGRKSFMVPNPVMARRHGNLSLQHPDFRNAQSDHPVDLTSSRSVSTRECRGGRIEIDDPEPRAPPPRRKAINPDGRTFRSGSTMAASAESSGISFVYPDIGVHGLDAAGMDGIGRSYAGKTALSGPIRGSERSPERERNRSDGISGSGRIGWTLPRVPDEASVRDGI